MMPKCHQNLPKWLPKVTPKWRNTQIYIQEETNITKTVDPWAGSTFVEKRTEEIAKNGIKEIVLTGVNIGEFKDKDNGRGFAALLKELEKVKGIERYRISSIEPNLLTNEIIEFLYIRY